MFRKTELEQLRLRKEQLVAQSEAYRSALAADWRRLQSPVRWLDETSGFLRRHPLWTTTLAAAGGTLAFKFLRGRSGLLGRIGRWGKLASIAFSAWRLFNRKKTKS